MGLASSLSGAIERRATTSGDLRVLSLEAELQLSGEHGVARRELELAALELGILPTRYLRSYGTVGLEGQRKLLLSRVAVVGAGGLGGYVVEGLARMGVGRIHVVDGDVFQDHNLNRQLLCSEADVGRSKAEAAVARVDRVNGAVEVVPHLCFLDAGNADDLLADAEIAVDALDSVPARLLLQESAARRGIPFIHGAIAGYYVQVTTVLPGDLGLFRFYRKDSPPRGVEATLGNPAATPMLCAALQVHETVKSLLGVGTLIRNRLLVVDAIEGSAEVVEFLHDPKQGPAVPGSQAAHPASEVRS
jgi:molybdopterin-synthase adenylyltransferase